MALPLPRATPGGAQAAQGVVVIDQRRFPIGARIPDRRQRLRAQHTTPRQRVAAEDRTAMRAVGVAFGDDSRAVGTVHSAFTGGQRSLFLLVRVPRETRP